MSIVGVRAGGLAANPSVLLMEVDGTVGENAYRRNLYVSETIEGRSPNGDETARGGFLPELVRGVSRRDEPRPERLQADRGRSFPRQERALPGCDLRPQRNETRGPSRSRADRSALTRCARGADASSAPPSAAPSPRLCSPSPVSVYERRDRRRVLPCR